MPSHRHVTAALLSLTGAAVGQATQAEIARATTTPLGPTNAAGRFQSTPRRDSATADDRV